MNTVLTPSLLRALAVAAVFLVTSCSGDDETPLESLPPEEIYKRGEEQLEGGDLEGAADAFALIERIYPYSEWAKRGTIMAAFSYHAAGEFEDARSAAQRFVEFYPADDDASYAQYLAALTYYDQVDRRGRDQRNSFLALENLRAVIEEYPDSAYARTSLLKFDVVIDQLAAKEMEVGRYYLKHGHYAAAINRFSVVAREFGTTSHAPEALHRMVEANLALGLEEEAVKVAAVLGHNYQSSLWYRDTYLLLTSESRSAPGLADGLLDLPSQFFRRTLGGEWL